MTGMAPSTTPDRRGLVTTIMAADPRNKSRLRSATETEVPTADLIWVVSAVSPPGRSPGLGPSEKAGGRRRRWADTARRQYGAPPPPHPPTQSETRARPPPAP